MIASRTLDRRETRAVSFRSSVEPRRKRSPRRCRFRTVLGALRIECPGAERGQFKRVLITIEGPRIGLLQETGENIF